MKKTETILREYVARLGPENMKYLLMRLDQRLGNDLAEALNTMSGYQDMDRWFKTADSCNELYDMIDTAQEFISREYRRRSPDVYQN